MQFDILIIGGGINGAGIARDAAGRGASVLLLEQSDLAGATSSASSKLIHGGLRYPEHYKLGLARKALAEREVLWRIAPHLVGPLRFEGAARVLLNAAGQWAARVASFALGAMQTAIRLVRGSHLIVRRRLTHGAAYTLQNADGRIMFALPCGDDLTLVGTTDRDHPMARIEPCLRVPGAREWTAEVAANSCNRSSRATPAQLRRSVAARTRRQFSARAHDHRSRPVFRWRLYEGDLRYLMEREWAVTAEDVLWRRSKLGLVFGEDEAEAIGAFLPAQLSDLRLAAV